MALIELFIALIELFMALVNIPDVLITSVFTLQAVTLFVSVALERLTREVKTSELRAMCLQVVISALYYNPPMLFELLNSLQISDQSVTEQFVKQWLHDCDTFLG